MVSTLVELSIECSWVCACRVAIFPFDVVKSKIQTDDLRSPRYSGTLDCARQVGCTPGTGLQWRCDEY